MCYCVGYGKPRCSLAAGESSRRSSPASRCGSAEKSYANRGGSSLRGSSRYSEPLDGDGGTGRTTGAESTTAGTTSGCAIGTASNNHAGGAYFQRVPRPV